MSEEPGAIVQSESEERSLKIRLEVFEGPLDLLLHLIRTQEIDIHDIPIAQITDQYLRYLAFMKDLSISLAGEWLAMAATLILIKSKMLLPPDPQEEGPEEGPEDPRGELVEQLLEYEKFKSAAQMLFERETIELSVWPRGADEFGEDETEVVDAGVFDLVQAFHKIVERFKDRVVIELEHEPVTLEDKLRELRGLLALKGELMFSSFLEGRLSRFHVVLTFFALLEMVRMREVRLLQQRLYEDIRIVAC